MINQTISHYKILEKLGAGGMGVVYKAKDLKLDRNIALKFLPPSFSQDPEAKQRFIHEAKSISSLQHNNICVVHEIDETNEGQLFICMELYEGMTLKKILEDDNLTIDKIVDIALQIADGLDKAHKKGIVHRDIKPANIFLTNDGIVKILDFGLSKGIDQTQLTQVGLTLGTSSYMSPEQSRGSNIDQRTDIWALGVILYEMVTGKKPFRGDYEQAIIYSILNEEPEPIPSICKNVPSEIINVIDKTLKKDAEKRYQNISEFIIDLEKASRNYSSVSKLKISSVKNIHPPKYIVYSVASIIVMALIVVLYFTLTKSTLAEPVTIALLPLKNINPEKSQDWFIEGMTDALITNLAKVGGIRIISRSSVMKYRNSDKPSGEIAAELGVLYLIDGSIVKLLNRIRITTRLIDASNDEYIWAQDYERDYADILSLQADVAKEISNQIQVKLSPKEKKLLSKSKKIDPSAYDAYLKGNFNLWKLTREGFKTALKYFRLATKIDPNYAPAHAGIVLAWRSQAQMGFLPYNVVLDSSREAENKALQLDSNLAEIHFMKAINYSWGEWEWELADKEFIKCLNDNPNMAEARAYYSQFLFITDRPEEGMRQIDIAREIDPFNKLFQSLYAMDLMYVHRYADVISLLETVLQNDPNEYMALSTLRSAYHQTQEFNKAKNIWIRSFEVRKDLEAKNIFENGYDKGGYLLALQEVAELFIKRRKEGFYVTPWQIATLYTRAGRKEEALNWFDKALEENDPNLPYLKVDPIFELLYSESRFIQILKKMGLNL